MKRILFLFTFVFFSATFCHSQSLIKNTSFYLIRHAEKLTDQGKDPALSEAGELRAVQWKQVFSKVKFDAILSTNYKRTRATALPTATANGVEITYYDPFKVDVNMLKEKYKGQTVLIVGHSNTTPLLANKLSGNSAYKDLDHGEYGSLFIVDILDSRTFVNKLKY